MRQTILLACIFYLGTSALPANAQARVDTLPCDRWIASLARGDTMPESLDALYRVDGCLRPEQLVVAARESGVRTLYARGQIGWMMLHLTYLKRDAEWTVRRYLAELLPMMTDKTVAQNTRGRVMLELANDVMIYTVARSAVYLDREGQPPDPNTYCTTTETVMDKGSVAFPQAQLIRIRTAAQLMASDSTEVPKLRQAARCLIAAVNDRLTP